MSPPRGAVARGAASGAAYTIAGVVQRGTPILLLPLYARALPTEEYGQVAIVVAATAVLGSLMSLGLETYVVRETVRLRDDPVGRQRFINSIGLLMLLAPIGAALVVGSVVTGLGGLSLQPDAFFLGVLGAALQTSMTVLVGAVLRAEERLRAYLAITLVQALATAGFTTVFVLGMGGGPVGWFAGALLGAAASLLVGLASLGHRWTTDMSRPVLAAGLVFGLPLLPHALSHWVLNLSDRIVLGAFVDHAQVGIYNLAYQAAAPIGLVVVAVHQGVMPLYARAGADAAIRRGLRRVATFHVHLTGWLGLAAILLAPPVIVALFPSAYAPAAPLVPWIGVGYVLFGLYVIPMDSLSLMIGRTRWLWIPTLAAASLNVALNVVLVPRFGVVAAAASTAVSYAILLVGILVARWRIRGPRIEYEVLRMGAGLGGLAVVAVLVSVSLPSMVDPLSLAVRLGAVIVTGVAVLLSGLRIGATLPGEGRDATDLGSGSIPANDDDLIMVAPHG
jgi:O-antigen/teichoic acid export membrane protein